MGTVSTRRRIRPPLSPTSAPATICQSPGCANTRFGRQTCGRTTASLETALCPPSFNTADLAKPCVLQPRREFRSWSQTSPGRTPQGLDRSCFLPSSQFRALVPPRKTRRANRMPGKITTGWVSSRNYTSASTFFLLLYNLCQLPELAAALRASNQDGPGATTSQPGGSNSCSVEEFSVGRRKPDCQRRKKAR